MRYYFLVLFSFLILSCITNETNSNHQHITFDSDGNCIGADSKDDFYWHLLKPKGGEDFKVGDTMVIQVCAEDAADHSFNQSPINYILYLENVTYKIPIIPQILGPENTWIIPDSLFSGFYEKTFQLRGTKGRIQVEEYNKQDLYRDSSGVIFIR